MCTRNCQPVLTSMDAIDILAFSFTQNRNCHYLKRVGLKHLTCSDKEFKCYLPFLVYNLKYDDGKIGEYLIKKMYS